MNKWQWKTIQNYMMHTLKKNRDNVCQVCLETKYIFQIFAIKLNIQKFFSFTNIKSYMCTHIHIYIYAWECVRSLLQFVIMCMMIALIVTIGAHDIMVTVKGDGHGD